MGLWIAHYYFCTWTFFKVSAFTLVFIFSLQLSSSFYVYQVSKKLGSADKILVFMGYKRISSGSQEIQELNYEGDVNTEKVLETAADLVILHSELELVKQLVDGVCGEPRLAATITLQEILRARSQMTHSETWPYLIKKAYTPQQLVVQQRADFQASDRMAQTQQGYFQRQASSLYPSQLVVSRGAEAMRRGSAPALSMNEQMLNVVEPRPALTLTPPLLMRGTAPETYSTPGRGYVPPDHPLQRPVQQHHQQHVRSAPSSVRAPDKPSSSVDKNMAEVYHDAHEKIHARSRHNRVEEMTTLTRAPEQLGFASVLHQPHVSDPSTQSHYSNLPLNSASRPANVSLGVQDTKPADGIYQNMQGLVEQGSPAAADGEHPMLPRQTVPRPFEVLHANPITRGADGYNQPGTVQSPSESQSEYRTAEYQKHHAHLEDSAKVREVEDLFQKFPNLVPGQNPANVYQNIPGPGQDPNSADIPFNLPEPMVDSEAELQKLARPVIPRDSIVSGIKNVRSVDYDNIPGPEDFLSGLQSQATTPQTPFLIPNQHEVDAWAIPPDAHRQPHSYPSSSGSNKDKHSPGSSLGDNIALQKHSSRSGSESEDLYNSEPSGEFEHPQRRGAPFKQIETVQETDETTKPEDGVVKDGITSTSEALKSRIVADSAQPTKQAKPIPAKRKLVHVGQKQKSFEVDTPSKPSVLPRKSKSGSNLLSSEEADTHSPVFSDPSSPTAPSDVTREFGPPSPSENAQIKVPVSQQPIPKPRERSSLSPGESAESKDESSLDIQRRPRVGGFHNPGGRPEQYSHKHKREVAHKQGKAPPTTDVSSATVESSTSAYIPHTVFDKGNLNSTGHSTATLNQPEYPKKETTEKPKKLNAAASVKGAARERSDITPPTPDDQRRDDLLQKVPNFDTKWICSYCMNIVYDPAVVCDVCTHYKGSVLGDSSNI